MGILPSKEFYQGYIGTQYGTNLPNLLHSLENKNN